MSTWRPAGSLVQLLAQVNLAHPARSKASDGIIGDRAHAASKSGHNPDAGGVVRALDLTHDPAHGLDTFALARVLIASRDRRILYVIAHRRICSSVVSPWTWRPYSGANPHTSHVHVEVVAGPAGDNAKPWSLGGAAQAVAASGGAAACPPFPGVVRRGDRSPAVRAVQQRLADRGWAIVVDAVCGAGTVKVVTAFQREKTLAADGVCGRVTWVALWVTP